VVVVPSNRHHICQQMMIKLPSEEEIQAITEEKLAQFFYNTFNAPPGFLVSNSIQSSS
jgi:hypothetical protein